MCGGDGMTTETAPFDYLAQTLEFVPACNLCGGCSWQVISDRDRCGFPAQFVLCEACGLVQLNPRMTAEAYADFYESGNYRRVVEQYMGRPYGPTELADGQRIYARSVCEALTDVFSPRAGQSMLDVGGSTGVVTHAIAQQFGLRATVLDPARSELDIADTLDLETIQGSAETWDSGGRTWDIVTMWQTVDHLLDINATLAKLRTLVAPGGLFIVDIVEFGHLLASNRTIDQALKIDHPFSLTDATMHAYLCRAGFTIVKKLQAKLRRKLFYVCEVGEPVDELPERASVAALMELVRSKQ